MSERIRTLLFGLGAMGTGMGRLATQRDEIELVGGVDSAPDKAGRPLHDVLGIEPPGGTPNPPVQPDAAEALAATKPRMVLHATGSYLPDVLPELLACAATGASVVSTCEELSYPWLRHPELAKQLDAEARARGVTVLGTGVNPGYVMDTLAVATSGVCQRVESVRLARIVDVATRREQLQRKVGVGLSVDEFRAKVATGRFGHVGLKESCWLVAEGMGWRLDDLEESIEPIVASDGRAGGMHQTARGTLGGRTVIDALVEMSVGAERPRDEIEIRGTPPVRMVIEGGVQGDLATAAVVLNCVPGVVGHAPGLTAMLNLPVVAGRGVTQ
jgi:4-hydroxy-tetrahydrodipicolinate reductase